jgi:hypothetical protein
MTQELPLDQFRFTDRVRVAWALAWPCILYDLVFYHFAIPRSSNHSIVWVATAIFGCLFFVPLVVRRTVRLEFPRLHLVVVRGWSGERTRTMTYRESLSVTWSLLVGSVGVGVVIALPVLGAVWGLLGAPPGGPFRVANQSTRVLFDPLGELLTFLSIFLILKYVIRHAYPGFALRLETTESVIDRGPTEVCS